MHAPDKRLEAEVIETRMTQEATEKRLQAIRFEHAQKEADQTKMISALLNDMPKAV